MIKLKLRYIVAFFYVCTLLLSSSLVVAAEQSGGENAINPLAKVKNTDLRWQRLELDGGRVNDFFIDGAFMAIDRLKIKYELHYWETDVTGNSETDWENDEAIPATGELQLGKNININFALYVDGFVGIGNDRPYDWGVGTGIRFKY